jgi:hypothetical protein
LLSLGPEAEKLEGFAFIAQIHSGDDASQLVLGRWTDHLIVMNGDDYKNRFKHPRISARLTPKHRTDGVNIRIRSSQTRTFIELDGEVISEREGNLFKIPSSPDPGRLVLGNSVYGSNSWAGEMTSFELGSVGSVNKLFRYRMSDLVRDRVSNLGAVSCALTIPSRRVVVDRQFLAWRFNHQFEFNRSFVSDFVVNLFGFIPFGVALSGMLHGRRMPLLQRVCVVVAAALVSLLIEHLQTWLPSRSSSSLDLLLNIAGGGLGAVLWALFLRCDQQTKKAGR